MRIERKPYLLNQSPFYKLKSLPQLADVLCVSGNTMAAPLAAQENYIRFTTRAGRGVQWPKPTLRRIQKRVADLLSRIETPEFLHSAKRGRSYITNADQHSPALPSVKVDIHKFFRSVRPPAVFHFFKDKMLCALDVAGVLTKLLTVDGYLPTGGNASPILSYFSYMDMFSEIELLAVQQDCAMSCLVDDMTFTGPGATGNLIFEVRRIMARYRLRAHKTKVFRGGQVKVITGVAVTMGGRRVPNKRQRAIARDLRDLSAAQSDEAQLRILPRAIGRLYEAAQVDAAWLPRAKTFATHRKVVQERLSGNIPHAARPRKRAQRLARPQTTKLAAGNPPGGS
jgi:RNA-directed DNA polymerase